MTFFATIYNKFWISDWKSTRERAHSHTWGWNWLWGHLASEEEGLGFPMDTCCPEGNKPGLSKAALGRLPSLRAEVQTRGPSSPLRSSPLIVPGDKEIHMSPRQKNTISNFQTEVSRNPYLDRADVSRYTKVRIVKTLYKCKGWTIKKAECRRIDAF